jgi:tRNA G46 methylase TrmB
LLTTEFFTIMHASLKEQGGLTIFSDNYKYMKLLARTVASARGEPELKSLLGNEVGERLFKSVTPRAFNG